MRNKEVEKIEKGHHYLCERVSHSCSHDIVEFECLEVSEYFYKLKNVLSEETFWIEKKNFNHCSNFEESGWFIREDLGRNLPELGDIKKDEK